MIRASHFDFFQFLKFNFIFLFWINEFWKVKNLILTCPTDDLNIFSNEFRSFLWFDMKKAILKKSTIFYGKYINIQLFTIIDSTIYGIGKNSTIGNPSSRSVSGFYKFKNLVVDTGWVFSDFSKLLTHYAYNINPHHQKSTK